MNDAAVLTWLLMGLLVLLMVTCIIQVLTARVRYEIEKHNLVVESKRRRIAYMQSITERQQKEEMA